MTKKANYLILAENMIQSGEMRTMVALALDSGFSFRQVESQIDSLRSKHDYRLLVDKTGIKHRYGLEMVGSSGFHCDVVISSRQRRDFVTELFAGSVDKALVLSKRVLRRI